MDSAKGLTSLNVSLPQGLREFVEGEAERTGCTTTSEYIRGLIRLAAEARSRTHLAEAMLQRLGWGSSRFRSADQILEEADGMLDFAVEAHLHLLREQHPSASEEEIQEMLKQWAAKPAPDGDSSGALRSNPKRLEKFLDEWSPKRRAKSPKRHRK